MPNYASEINAKAVISGMYRKSSCTITRLQCLQQHQCWQNVEVLHYSKFVLCYGQDAVRQVSCR